MEGKPCIRCGATDRNKRGKCIPCSRSYIRAWSRAHPDRARRWAIANPEKARAGRRASKLRVRYGICSDKALEMWNAQNRQCPLCGIPIPSPLKDSRKGAGCHVDHDHLTGKVRGLTCTQCNNKWIAALDKFLRNQDFFKRCLDYVGVP